MTSEPTQIGQCPGCFSMHMVPMGRDWECDCGERVTIIDLRAGVHPDAGLNVERLVVWWCPGWQTLNAIRYHGVGAPCCEGCGSTAYRREYAATTPSQGSPE